MRGPLVLAIYLLVFRGFAGAATLDLNGEIGAALHPLSGHAGVSLAVVHHGKMIFSGGAGLADLSHETPMTGETVIDAGSIAKQVTAFAVLLLEREGKLNLDDEVHTYVPELPDYGKPITLRNLLRHRSGIRDVVSLLALGGAKLDYTASGDRVTYEQALRAILRQKGLNNAPGDEVIYSNGGYVLLAEVVARVSGRPLPAFCAENIFRPLGMTNTRIVADEKDIPGSCAKGYVPIGETLAPASTSWMVYGSSNLYTTSSDLARWLNNFRTGEVGGRELIARLFRATPDNWKADFQLGVETASWRGQRLVLHNGFIGGFNSYVVWFPDHELGIAVIGNRIDFAPLPVAYQMAEIVLREKLTPAAPSSASPERKFVTVSPTVLKRYVGAYALPAIQEAEDFRLVQDKLWWGGFTGWPTEMKALAENRFWVDRFSAEAEFTPGEQGAMHLRIIQASGISEGSRLGSVTKEEMVDYLGRFASDEMKGSCTIEVKQGRLCVVHSRWGEIPLLPIKTDGFQTDQAFMRHVEFVRGADRRVIAVIFDSPGARRIRFDRSDAGAFYAR